MHERRPWAWVCAGLMLAALCGAPRAALAAIPPDFAAIAASYGAQADFDCDGRADISRRINNGVWEIDLAANGFGQVDRTFAGYGNATAIPVPADYDGDCLADLSVKDASGNWYIDYARDGFGAWNQVLSGWGPDTSVPVPADYDGDGKADLSVKGADGIWRIAYAAHAFGPPYETHAGYGNANAIPVPADYDGDRIADLSVKSDGGCWYIDYARDHFGTWNDPVLGYCGYGNASAVPVPADYDGDGIADLAVKGPDGTWYVDWAAGGFGAWNAIYPGYSAPRVLSRNEPLPADYDGDGRADLSLHSVDEFWYIDFSGNGIGNTSPFDLHDALSRPVSPRITLTGHTAHTLRIVVTAEGPDADGHSSAERVFLTANGVTSSSIGTTTSRFLTNLEDATTYCVDATAVNNEGSTSRSACFRTDFEP